MQLHISIAAETVTTLFGLPITNSLIMTWIVMAFIIAFALLSTKKLTLIPGNLQFIAELLVGGLYNFFGTILSQKKLKALFPLVATIFIFVLVSNWAGLIPGLSAIGIQNEQLHANRLGLSQAVAVTSAEPIDDVQTQNDVEHAGQKVAAEGALESEAHEEVKKHATFIPIFRGPTADLNTTIALGLISVGAMIFYGIKYLGVAFFLRYFNFSNPIMTFVGILELISDISKILSFGFRLFGNIFAGEVLLAVMGYLVPLIAPIPFLGLELFVGVIQALVFAMLTAVFISMASESHGDHKEEHDGQHAQMATS